MCPEMPNTNLTKRFNWMVSGVVSGGNEGRRRMTFFLRLCRSQGFQSAARDARRYAFYVGYPEKGCVYSNQFPGNLIRVNPS